VTPDNAPGAVPALLETARAGLTRA